jgi:hypothetical protein
MMRSFLWIVIILVIIPGFLFSQDSLLMNQKYVNFEINRTPFISAGYFLQDGLALEAGIGFAFDGEINSNGLGLRIGLDKYFGSTRLTPFAGGYVLFEINPNALSSASWEGSRLTFGGQWGLNYFVLDNLAIAGSIGGELLLNSPKDTGNSSKFTSFTSGIKFRFFF